MQSSTTWIVLYFIGPYLTLAKPLVSVRAEFNPDLFEGDIIGINANDILAGKQPRNAMVYEELLWPDGVVHYTISADFNLTEIDIINTAITEYETKSCIRFVARTNEPDYISIEKTGSGCFSYIGRTGFAQVLSLDSSCFNGGLPGTTIHELLHALGFFHEQSRTDRDDYITINYPNIQPGTENNFLAYGPDVLQYLGASYDYGIMVSDFEKFPVIHSITRKGSVMHYGAYSFAQDPTIPTIYTRQPGVEIGQRRGFSEVDLFKLNALYKCDVAK